MNSRIETLISKFNLKNREYNGKFPNWIGNKYSGLFQQYLFYYTISKRRVDSNSKN